MSLYDDRIAAFNNYSFVAGEPPEHGIDNPITADLGEYYRRTVQFKPDPLIRIPMNAKYIVAWSNGMLTNADLKRVEADMAKLRPNRSKVLSTTRDVFEDILLWTLLVERNKLALGDDPSVPMLRIFAAGYDLKAEGADGFELAFWGGTPWTIRLIDVLKKEGLDGV